MKGNQKGTPTILGRPRFHLDPTPLFQKARGKSTANEINALRSERPSSGRPGTAKKDGANLRVKGSCGFVCVLLKVQRTWLPEKLNACPVGKSGGVEKKHIWVSNLMNVRVSLLDLSGGAMSEPRSRGRFFFTTLNKVSCCFSSGGEVEAKILNRVQP